MHIAHPEVAIIGEQVKIAWPQGEPIQVVLPAAKLRSMQCDIDLVLMKVIFGINTLVNCPNPILSATELGTDSVVTIGVRSPCLKTMTVALTSAWFWPMSRQETTKRTAPKYMITG